jgi:prevent-host-death family protein
VSFREAKTHLARLLDRVSQGEGIIIAKAGKLVARLVSVQERPEQRVLGSASGQIVGARTSALRFRRRFWSLSSGRDEVPPVLGDDLRIVRHIAAIIW